MLLCLSFPICGSCVNTALDTCGIGWTHAYPGLIPLPLSTPAESRAGSDPRSASSFPHSISIDLIRWRGINGGRSIGIMKDEQRGSTSKDAARF